MKKLAISIVLMILILTRCWTTETLLPEQPTTKWKNMSSSESYAIYREKDILYNSLRNEVDRLKKVIVQQEILNAKIVKNNFVPKYGMSLGAGAGVMFDKYPDQNTRANVNVSTSFLIFLNRRGIVRFYLSPGLSYNFSTTHNINFTGSLGVLF